MRRARPALGTIVEIEAAQSADAGVEQAVMRAFDAVERVQRLMSFHAPDSDLARLNRDAYRRPVAVHRWTRLVLRAAQALWRDTEGWFDCTVAPTLVTHDFLPLHAGFDPGGRYEGSMADIEFERAGRVRFRRPLSLDLGGIAKGFAVDRAIEILQSAGVECGVVNAGGDLRVFGPRPEFVHVRDPQRPGAFIRRGPFSNIAIATSAAYHSRKTIAGRPVSHFVNPRTRMLLDVPYSATIVAASCMIADALTKAVILSGSDRVACLARYRATAFIDGGGLGARAA